jgi:hypothetical protein
MKAVLSHPHTHTHTHTRTYAHTYIYIPVHECGLELSLEVVSHHHPERPLLLPGLGDGGIACGWVQCICIHIEHTQICLHTGTTMMYSESPPGLPLHTILHTTLHIYELVLRKNYPFVTTRTPA